MSTRPLKGQAASYGAVVDEEEQAETGPLLAAGTSSSNLSYGAPDVQRAEVIYQIFSSVPPPTTKSHPDMPPEKRFARHRNYYIYNLNQFRHWWKTSRLLVRLSGGFEYCWAVLNWTMMALLHVGKRKQGKQALKSLKAIGRGGVSRDFLKIVQPFTRSVRIVLAVARAWEARVDNRLVEVGIAEGLAFMGNRCSRWIGRTVIDESAKRLFFPLSAAFLEPHLDQNSRPVIVTMGFLRAILPFSLSFTGSAIGRQLTFNTFKYANYRWLPTQGILDFHQTQGSYQDTALDAELEELAHKVAVAIGDGQHPSETQARLKEDLKFALVGAGSGGHVRCVLRKDHKIISLYVTPYGPSIVDQMPRYIVLERRPIHDDHLPQPIEASVEGYTYSGAFFKNQEWAALANRFEDEHASYRLACKRLGTRQPKVTRNPLHGPPTDLATLKTFVRSGHTPKKKSKDKKRWKQIEQEIHELSGKVRAYQKSGRAPKNVILYLEGLDCVGKSSTANLICAALEECGYKVRTAQHNRPPTSEQRQKPWMDRGRFEYPEDVYEGNEEVPEYNALVWDRGPAGDFVYGGLHKLDMDAKMEKYQEFREYDANCRSDGLMFCKFLFVSDKDSIASTLGKRLAHKRIAQDLRAWLDSSSGGRTANVREGLEAIEAHIDPSDFVAFNEYTGNLEKFTEFARNTDNVGHVGLQANSTIGYDNPWKVISTSKRHLARLAILKSFEHQLDRYATDPTARIQTADALLDFFNVDHFDDGVPRPLPREFVDDRKHGISIRAVFQAVLLMLLVYFYAYITWKIDWLGLEY